eukprot:g2060.t1
MRWLWSESDKSVTVFGLGLGGIFFVGLCLTALVLALGKRMDRMSQTRRMRQIIAAQLPERLTASAAASIMPLSPSKRGKSKVGSGVEGHTTVPPV